MSVKPLQTDQANKETAPVVPLRPASKASVKQKTYHQRPDNLHKVRIPRKDNTLSRRYELKYRIPEAKARAIAHYIQSYIAADKYARDCPDHQYLISSLYLDSPQLHLCQETLDQKVNRFKLRIRCYDDKPETPCFFEIKRRLNNIIVKGRARVAKDSIQSLIEGETPPDTLYKKDREILRQFQFYLHMLQAKPITLVRYMRQAYEDDSQNRVRITFDRQLSCRAIDQPIVTTNGSGWHLVQMDFVVLEIKFTNFFPVWLNEVIKIFDLKQTAMSKYVSSVKQSRVLGYNTIHDLGGVYEYG